ncbi:hypothetical protein [Snodgrassella alvi]|uniref:hypothetical protein n=1 Tax=Snodgrassella alvi TaxID=1196083 RepID=UPI00345F211E
MQTLLIVFLFSIFYYLVFTYVDFVYQKRFVKKLISKRKNLSDKEILAFYLHSNLSESSILELWNEVATNFNIPSGYLRPEDCLVKMGTLKVGVDHPKVESLEEIALERQKKINKSIDLESIATLDDYIKSFADKN